MRRWLTTVSETDNNQFCSALRNHDNEFSGSPDNQQAAADNNVNFRWSEHPSYLYCWLRVMQ